MSNKTINSELKDRFRGALLGTFIGDALGMPMEGRRGNDLKSKDIVRDMLNERLGRGTYTDDTQMMIGLAEAFLENPGCVDQDRIAKRFSENYDRKRGYGGNARSIISEIKKGKPWKEAVALFPLPGGGSMANGAAMRVAPCALAFYPDFDTVGQAAEKQAAVTGHTHPVGLFGAKMQALAVLQALISVYHEKKFPAESFIQKLTSNCPSRFNSVLNWLKENLDARPQKAAEVIGTRSLADCSVPMALWCFLSCSDDPEEVVVRSVNLGGDADTIGAMAGAIAGAYHGASSFPKRWVKVLENGNKGKDYVIKLADQIFEKTYRRLVTR